jgi:hypothetical protein
MRKTGDKRVFDLLRTRGADPEVMDFNGNRLRDYVSPEQARYLGVE